MELVGWGEGERGLLMRRRGRKFLVIYWGRKQIILGAGVESYKLLGI